MKLDDAVFNWLQMKHVVEQRPDDNAARETYQFFSAMLEEDFQLENIVVNVEDPMYIVRFVHEGKETEKKFPIEFVHQLLHMIESEPKYNE